MDTTMVTVAQAYNFKKKGSISVLRMSFFLILGANCI